ncbi:AAA family ATPase [Winogradskyella tangerina]|uniref:AAA family ATPase n=1 Tax=Winogradskyella tangerina TaxID=2023240 RepID=UPI000DBE666C|nr:AAA family ATPase [Winogradskyella tangerina]
MNFWHIQLHPNDSSNFNEKRVIELLSQKKIIGLGQWEKGESLRNQFYNEMKEGDIVAVKSGNRPIALVMVDGPAFKVDVVNKNLDWFPFRRKIKILDFYDPAYNFTFPDSRGTLKICRDRSKSTSQRIINWYLLAQRKTLMENIKLSNKRISEIKELWKQYQSEYDDIQLRDIEKQIEELQHQWKIYCDKIKDDSLTIDDYTNRKNSDDAAMPGGYLCNFFERTTRVIYGSSKPGNANNFMVKLNEDGETYTLKKELRKGEKQTEHTKEQALEVFNQSIKPLLKTIVISTNPEDIISAIESSDYHGKQVLRKAAVLNNHHTFLSMYSDDAINTLHNEFVLSDEIRNLGKTHEIRLIINDLLNIDTSNRVESVLLSRFLWKYATITGIADEDSPNVILYGPPGTGKTYSVHNSLKYLCQGDKSRYEMVQFHPSFTYEDFIEGIKPKGVTENGNIKFNLVDGIFKKFCKKAKKECIKANEENRDPNSYYFIVDEINRANLSSVFGETLSLLEKDYRHNGIDGDNLMKTQYSGLIEDLIKDNPSNKSLAYHLENGNVYFGVPKNVFFIGMMNDVDKSIDTFDLALRRRFKWIRKDCDYDVIENDVKYRNGEDFNNIETYRKCCESLNKYISEDLGLGKSYEFGHSFFMKISDISNSKNITKKNLENLFKLHLQPTFREYLRAMFPESELDKKIDEGLKYFTNPIKGK